jgi:hypothetical protein
VLCTLSPTCSISKANSLEEGEGSEDSVHPTSLAGGGGWPQAALNGENFAVQLQGLHGKIVVICERCYRLDVKFSPHGWRLGGHALNRYKDLLEDLSIDEQSGETFLAPGRGLVGWISSLR